MSSWSRTPVSRKASGTSSSSASAKSRWKSQSPASSPWCRTTYRPPRSSTLKYFRRASPSRRTSGGCRWLPSHSRRDYRMRSCSLMNRWVRSQWSVRIPIPWTILCTLSTLTWTQTSSGWSCSVTLTTFSNTSSSKYFWNVKVANTLFWRILFSIRSHFDKFNLSEYTLIKPNTHWTFLLFCFKFHDKLTKLLLFCADVIKEHSSIWSRSSAWRSSSISSWPCWSS